MDEFLTIGIVTYNSARVLPACLKSVESSTNGSYRTIVVDNNSTDETHEIVSGEFPEIEVFNTGANFGFGYGVNQIVKHSKTKYVLVLNADIEVNSGTIQPLVDALENDPQIFIAAPVTYDSNGNLEGNIRKFPTLVLSAFEAIFGGTIAQKLNMSETISKTSYYRKQTNVDWIKGAIWCVRRSDFVELNGMRNDYFLYSEETDIARRGYLSNKLTAIVPDSKATHLGGESDTDPILYSLLNLNKLKYFKSDRGTIGYIFMRKILFLAMLIRVNKKQSRYALKCLVQSIFGLGKEREKLIGLLGGKISQDEIF